MAVAVAVARGRVVVEAVMPDQQAQAEENWPAEGHSKAANVGTASARMVSLAAVVPVALSDRPREFLADSVVCGIFVVYFVTKWVTVLHSWG